MGKYHRLILDIKKNTARIFLLLYLCAFCAFAHAAGNVALCKRIMEIWRANQSLSIEQVLTQAGGTVTEADVAEILLRTQREGDLIIINKVFEYIRLNGMNHIQISQTVETSSRRAKLKYPDKIKQFFQQLKEEHYSQEYDSEASDTEASDTEASDKKNGATSSFTSTEKQNPHTSDWAQPLTSSHSPHSPPSYTESFSHHKELDSISPGTCLCYKFDSQQHQFNVDNFTKHIQLLKKLSVHATSIREKIFQNKLSQSDKKAFKRIDINGMVSLLKQSGKAHPVDFLNAFIDDKTQKTKKGINSLKAFISILESRNPFNLPYDSLVLSFPLMLFSHIVHTCTSERDPLANPDGRYSKLSQLYKPARSVEASKHWDTVYKVVDGLDLNPSTSQQEVELSLELAESALSDIIPTLAGTELEHPESLIAALIDSSPRAHGSQHPLASCNATDLHLLYNAVSETALFEHPCISILTCLYRLKPENLINTEDEGEDYDDDDDDDDDESEDNSAMIIAEEKVKVKLEQQLGDLSSTDAIIAIIAISETWMNEVGLPPISLLKAYKKHSPSKHSSSKRSPSMPVSSSGKALSGRYHSGTAASHRLPANHKTPEARAVQTDFSQDPRLFFDRKNTFYDVVQINEIMQKVADLDIDASSNWRTFAQALGFNDKFEPDIVRSGSAPLAYFQSLVETWLEQPYDKPDFSPGKELNWQILGRAIQRLDNAKARTILQGIWVTYFIEEQSISTAHMLFLVPTRAQLFGRTPLVENLPQRLKLALLRTESETDICVWSRFVQFGERLIYKKTVSDIIDSTGTSNAELKSALSGPIWEMKSKHDLDADQWIDQILRFWVGYHKGDTQPAWVDLFRALETAITSGRARNVYMNLYESLLDELIKNIPNSVLLQAEA